jgi:hypothetical protein
MRFQDYVMVHHQRINASANEVAAFTRVCSVLREFTWVSPCVMCVVVHGFVCALVSESNPIPTSVFFFC